MSYYELRMVRRGFPPNQLTPAVRPASDRVGSETKLFEAHDDDAAAEIGKQRERELAEAYIVTVHVERDGERVMIYPRKGSDD